MLLLIKGPHTHKHAHARAHSTQRTKTLPADLNEMIGRHLHAGREAQHLRPVALQPNRHDTVVTFARVSLEHVPYGLGLGAARHCCVVCGLPVVGQLHIYSARPAGLRFAVHWGLCVCVSDGIQPAIACVAHGSRVPLM